MKHLRNAMLAATLVLFGIAEGTSAAPPSIFTYQGQLKHQGAPVNGEGRFSFTLWDADVDGRQVGSVVETRADIVNGLFTVQLDFGPDAFRGEPRWLEIRVVTNQGEGRLSPRQPITPAPFALYALNAPGGGGGELTLPFAGTNTTNETAIAVTNSGLAPAAAFATDNVSNVQAAVVASTAGSGAGLLAMTAGTGPAVWGLTGDSGGLAGLFKVQGTTATQVALGVENSAMGSAGHFKTTKRENTNPALIVETFSDGPAATFTTHSDLNNVNVRPTVAAENNSFGMAGEFGIQNSESTNDALRASTNGGGNAIHAYTNGSGRAGFFEVDNFGARTLPAFEVVSNGRGAGAGFFKTTNALNTSAALMGEANGDGDAIRGVAMGSGAAVTGYNAHGGNAIVGVVDARDGNAGSFTIGEPTNYYAAVRAITNGTGPAGWFENTNTTSGGSGLYVSADGGGGSSYASLRVHNTNRDDGVAVAANNNSSGASLVVKNSGTGPLISGWHDFEKYFEVDGLGHVTAGSYRYNVPREGKYSLGRADFVAGIPDQEAGVHLPNGAVLTSMKVFAWDSGVDEDLVFKLYRLALISGDLESLAVAKTSGASGRQSVTTHMIAEPIIDNDNYAYRVNTEIEPASGSNVTTIVTGVVFTYTTMGPD